MDSLDWIEKWAIIWKYYFISIAYPAFFELDLIIDQFNNVLIYFVAIHNKKR